MTRPLRITYEGAVYHVTIRGNERRSIFKDDSDRYAFLDKLSESVRRYGVRLYLYCLMTNHAHFVLETPQGNLSRFMQRFQTAYTLYYNRTHNRSGHLMQGRFGSRVVDEDEYIMRLSRYVHLNPVFVRKLKLLPIEDRVDFLRKYPWSSYRSYIGLCSPIDFVDYGPVLAMMSRTKKKQKPLYQDFVEMGIAEEDISFVASKNRSILSIGSESCHERVDAFYEAMVSDEDELCCDTSFKRIGHAVSVEDILSSLCKVLKIDQSELYLKRRNSMVRPIAAYALCEFGQLTLREVAKVLQLTSGASVSSQIKRLTVMMQTDSSARRVQEKLSKCLIKSVKR